MMSERADRLQEAGKFRSAFRLFLACARAGDSGCQNNVGNFYRDGIGIRPNRERALYWYRRAYRRGLRGAASNIGVLFRDENNFALALAWFKRAGDGDADLAIANMYLGKKSPSKAVPYLQQAFRSHNVSEASREEAERLLKNLRMANG